MAVHQTTISGYDSDDIHPLLQLDRTMHSRDRKSALILAASILLLGIIVQGLLSCTTSRAQTTGAVPPVTQRTIDWNKADSDIADLRSSGTIPPAFSVRESPMFSKVLKARRAAVPLMLPPRGFELAGSGGGNVNFMLPTVLFVDGGYTAVLKSPAVDMLIDARDSMLVSSESADNLPPPKFIGRIQPIEGGGKRVSIGRYGALYSIQLICNQPAASACVSTDQVLKVVWQLLPTDLDQIK